MINIVGSEGTNRTNPFDAELLIAAQNKITHFHVLLQTAINARIKQKKVRMDYGITPQACSERDNVVIIQELGENEAALAD